MAGSRDVCNCRVTNQYRSEKSKYLQKLTLADKRNIAVKKNDNNSVYCNVNFLVFSGMTLLINYKFRMMTYMLDQKYCKCFFHYPHLARSI